MYTAEDLKYMTPDKAVPKAVLPVSFHLNTANGCRYIDRVTFSKLMADVTDPMSDDPRRDYVYLQRGRISLYPNDDSFPASYLDVDKNTGNRLYVMMKNGNREGYCRLLKSLGVNVAIAF